MDILSIALQLILSLSILVVLHEFGHFLPAKLFKTRVEKFYLFFNPGFALFKFKRGETEYGIGWLPLGGYVKISGMIDESMDKDQMSQPPQPWEFRAKPTWQRLIIMVGGVTVNLILGIVIFMLVLFAYGRDTLPTENVTYGIACDSLLYQYGFEDGDKIMLMNGEKPDSFNDVRLAMLLEDIRTVTVERNGQNYDLNLPPDFGQMMIDSGIQTPFSVRIPTVIGSFTEESNAEAAGMLVGDSIVGINEIESPFFSDIQKAVLANKGKEVEVHFYRDGQAMTLPIAVSEVGMIGFSPIGDLTKYFTFVHQEFGFLESIPAGYNHARNTLTNYIVSMKFLFSKSGASQIGGFGTIASLFDASWDWRVFWERTAWLSLILAFMNILPIPALDGGHVMFLLYEMIAGRPPGQKFMERAQIIGMILLLGLLLFANGNDIWRYFFK
jgi:regulator of sigma E protease